MFNLIVSYSPESWNLDPYEIDKSRFLEFTEESIRGQFKELNVEKLELLKKLPTLFAIEGDEHETRIGYVTNLKLRSKSMLVEYKFDPILPPLPPGSLEKLEKTLDIPPFERIRTHWAIKDEDLIEILTNRGYYTIEQAAASKLLRDSSFSITHKSNNIIDSLNNNHVFIVHGRDEETKYQVSTFISELGLVPIILHEQANLGKTIIEKIETYTNVGFAIVLYTPCDVGALSNPYQNSITLNYRARQNVILEHGYLMAKLGRKRVAALVKGNIETPNDISGVVYINYDQQGEWKKHIKREIVAAGISL